MCIRDRYEVDGEKTDDFPFTAVIGKAKPVMTSMPGWNCDISGVRKYEDLPVEARNYVAVSYTHLPMGFWVSDTASRRCRRSERQRSSAPTTSASTPSSRSKIRSDQRF